MVTKLILLVLATTTAWRHNATANGCDYDVYDNYKYGYSDISYSKGCNNTELKTTTITTPTLNTTTTTTRTIDTTLDDDRASSTQPRTRKTQIAPSFALTVIRRLLKKVTNRMQNCSGSATSYISNSTTTEITNNIHSITEIVVVSVGCVFTVILTVIFGFVNAKKWWALVRRNLVRTVDGRVLYNLQNGRLHSAQLAPMSSFEFPERPTSPSVAVSSV